MLSEYIGGGAIELIDAAVKEDEGDGAADDEAVIGEADLWLGQLSPEHFLSA